MDRSTRDPSFWAPGTITLENLHRSGSKPILHPVPSSDPNDPLNWATWRKVLNFSLIASYCLWTFVQLDIGFEAWNAYEAELGFTVDDLNAGAAINYAGLGIGCMLFIPFVYKYGRRPVYIFSTALQLAACIWYAKTKSYGDFLGSNLISGLGGAISETIIQITIADMFFLHHHAAMNGWYLFSQFVGSYLGPVAAGYIVDSQGWQWIFWWCVIFLAIQLVLTIFLFEESKYVSVIQGQSTTQSTGQAQNSEVTGEATTTETNKGSRELPTDAKEAESAAALEPIDQTEQYELCIDPTIKMKSYRERLALITKTDGSLLHDFYQPIIVLFSFPAVTYTAITYGTLLAWFAALTSVQATYLYYPPYNFSAAGVGLMNIAPFIGTTPVATLGGWLNDKSIMWLAKRNGGVYEPEMRLWMAVPAALIVPAGILMFGLGLANGTSWPLLAVGFGFYGFGFALAGDVALAYVMDCYHDIIGNALVGVVFTRNALSVIILFTLTPWINGMGLQNMHILIAVLCFAFLLLPVPLLIWGKKARIATAKSYRKMASQQPTRRAL